MPAGAREERWARGDADFFDADLAVGEAYALSVASASPPLPHPPPPPLPPAKSPVRAPPYSTEEAAEEAEEAEEAGEAEEAEEAEEATSDRMVWVNRSIQSTVLLSLVMLAHCPCPVPRTMPSRPTVLDAPKRPGTPKVETPPTRAARRAPAPRVARKRPKLPRPSAAPGDPIWRKPPSPPPAAFENLTGEVGGSDDAPASRVGENRVSSGVVGGSAFPGCRGVPG